MTAALEKELKRLRERHEASPEGRAFAPLADVYRKLGRLEEAYDLCHEGLERHPQYSTAVVILAKVLRDRGELVEAIDAFERVLDLDSLNLLARAELARLFEKLGQEEQALEHWRQLLQYDPSGQEAEEAVERLSAWEPEASVEEPTPESAELAEEPVDLPAAPPEPSHSHEAPAVLEASLDEPDNPLDHQHELSGPATPTLARIYYEQGFKAKALEVYKRVLSQRGADAALSERIQEIHDELQHVERRRAEQPVDGGELLEAADSNPAEAPTPNRDSAPLVAGGAASGKSSEVEVLAASIEASDPEREDYGHFRSWLDRVRDR